MSTVQLALEELQASDGSPPALATMTMLADQSRESAVVRSQLAEPRVLQTLVNLVQDDTHTALESRLLALRCIGNACNDDGGGDDARDELVRLGFEWAARCLRQDFTRLGPLTIKALYNACAEHEAAQKRCFADLLHYDLIRYMTFIFKRRELGLPTNPVEDEEMETTRELAVDVLFAIGGQKPAQSSTEGMHLGVLRQLIYLPREAFPVETQPEVRHLEMYASLVECLLVFLRDPAVQDQVINDNNVKVVWMLLELSEKTYLSCTETPPLEDDVENIPQLLISLSTSLTWILSDMAANRSFAEAYDLENDLIVDCLKNITTSPLFQTDITPIRRESEERITAAAAQVVGNLFWTLPPDRYSGLVIQSTTISPVHHERRRLCSAILELIELTKSDDLLHALAGFLLQLARPSVQTREVIGGDLHAETAIERLCHHERPEIRQDAIKVLKALGNECSVNQARFADLAREVMESLSNVPPPQSESIDVTQTGQLEAVAEEDSVAETSD